MHPLLKFRGLSRKSMSDHFKIGAVVTGHAQRLPGVWTYSKDTGVTQKRMERMRYEVNKDRLEDETWHVEPVPTDYHSDRVTFTGVSSWQMARQYAAWKNTTTEPSPYVPCPIGVSSEHAWNGGQCALCGTRREPQTWRDSSPREGSATAPKADPLNTVDKGTVRETEPANIGSAWSPAATIRDARAPHPLGRTPDWIPASMHIEQQRQEIERLEKALAVEEADRKNWREEAERMAKDREFYHGIVNEVGQVLGTETRVADDGTVMESPLALKIVPVLRQQMKRLWDARMDADAQRNAVNEQLSVAKSALAAVQAEREYLEGRLSDVILRTVESGEAVKARQRALRVLDTDLRNLESALVLASTNIEEAARWTRGVRQHTRGAQYNPDRG